MVRAGMGECGRDAGIQVLVRVAEQIQRRGDERGRKRGAARRRRLQRSHDEIAGAPRFDRDLGLVEGQREYAVAVPECQRRAQRDGCMSTERHFRCRREITNPPAATGSRGKGGLRESDFGCDPLHFVTRREFIDNGDSRGIPSGIPVGERSNPEDIHFFSLTKQ